VSSPDQKEDSVRQVALLESFCAANGWTFETLQDVGSGLNDHKKGLRQLIRRIVSGEVGRLVITHQDRLLRFGSELVFSLCEHFGTEVVIINASEETPMTLPVTDRHEKGRSARTRRTAPGSRPHAAQDLEDSAFFKGGLRPINISHEMKNDTPSARKPRDTWPLATK